MPTDAANAVQIVLRSCRAIHRRRLGHLRNAQHQAQSRFIDTRISVSDTAGRWGGEEFLILCPETDIFGAMDLAENIRQKIERHDFDIPKKITVSLGVAEYCENQCTESFMKRADDAFYDAKKAGRNRVRASV